jgi:hypothetical protein
VSAIKERMFTIEWAVDGAGRNIAVAVMARDYAWPADEERKDFAVVMMKDEVLRQLVPQGPLIADEVQIQQHGKVLYCWVKSRKDGL